MSIFCLVCLIVLVSQRFDDFFCVSAGIVQLICWAVRALMSFSVRSLD